MTSGPTPIVGTWNMHPSFYPMFIALVEITPRGCIYNASYSKGRYDSHHPHWDGNSDVPSNPVKARPRTQPTRSIIDIETQKMYRCRDELCQSRKHKLGCSETICLSLQHARKFRCQQRR